MTALQRYVSDELTHFVGAGIRRKGGTHEEMYCVLKEILSSTKLLPNSLDTRGYSLGGGGATAINPSAPLHEMFVSEVVCFCDIPVENFGVHIRKYGPFGMAFEKSFLVAHGANPVLYLAEESKARTTHYGNGTRAGMFEEGMRDIHMSLFKLSAKSDSGGRLEGVNLISIRSFLTTEVFSFVKPFSSALSDDDSENFYMEREWRLAGALDFALEDVSRIILPRDFARRFREDFPGYFGQVSFATSPPAD